MEALEAANAGGDWSKRINVGGLVEVEAVKMEEDSDIYTATVELDIEAEINDATTASSTSLATTIEHGARRRPCSARNAGSCARLPDASRRSKCYNRRMFRRLRTYFFTGLLVLGPLAVTGYIVYRLFVWVDHLLSYNFV